MPNVFEGRRDNVSALRNGVVSVKWLKRWNRVEAFGPIFIVG